MQHVARTILVTGASSGIGRAIARALIAQGHLVLGISRDISQFTTSVVNFQPIQLDLAQLPELTKATQTLVQQYPNLDAVVFSAGIGQFGNLEEFSCLQIQNLMNLNFMSSVFITRILLPFFKQKNRSDLIFIGSEAALRGSRKGSIYCASKFALRGFTQALREESSKDGIRVCLINPGMVKTPFFDKLGFAPGDHEQNYLQPEDVAEAVSYVLNSRAVILVDELNLNPATKVVKKK